uniref:Uncharacterized protein n=1 Tax=viral metagenome TaxID=1070528 RepID=A0A6C0C833_9ZZZZ
MREGIAITNGGINTVTKGLFTKVTIELHCEGTPSIDE